jgi:phosphoribosylanthranilate isomerase
MMVQDMYLKLLPGEGIFHKPDTAWQFRGDLIPLVIKICGITRPEDVRCAVKYGADAIGVVMFSDSKRSIDMQRAREIFMAAGPEVMKVVVTHTKSEEEIQKILSIRPDAIQVSYPFIFPPDRSYKVIRVTGNAGEQYEDCDAVIIDGSMGSGTLFNHSFAEGVVKQSHHPVYLAGGLTPENVADAIRTIRPYAVDVASGVEVSPGIKNCEKIRKFIENARAAEREIHD